MDKRALEREQQRQSERRSVAFATTPKKRERSRGQKAGFKTISIRLTCMTLHFEHIFCIHLSNKVLLPRRAWPVLEL